MGSIFSHCNVSSWQVHGRVIENSRTCNPVTIWTVPVLVHVCGCTCWVNLRVFSWGTLQQLQHVQDSRSTGVFEHCQCHMPIANLGITVCWKLWGLSPMFRWSHYETVYMKQVIIYQLCNWYTHNIGLWSSSSSASSSSSSHPNPRFSRNFDAAPLFRTPYPALCFGAAWVFIDPSTSPGKVWKG